MQPGFYLWGLAIADRLQETKTFLPEFPRLEDISLTLRYTSQTVVSNRLVFLISFRGYAHYLLKDARCLIKASQLEIEVAYGMKSSA